MLSEAFLRRLEGMQLRMRAPAQGGAGGLRRSRALGSSVEFSDFREYAAGDDLRRVDWNAYARFDRLFLKLFMEEQETQVNILLDDSASMAPKWTLAQDLAQLFACLALRGGDRVTLYALGGGHCDGLHGRAGMLRAAEFLEKQAPHGEVRLCDALPRLPLRGGRGVCLLLTDLLSPDGYETGLQSLLYRRQEAELLHLLSPEELDPPLNGMLRLIDSETGEARELLVNAGMLADYRRALDGLCRGAEAFCHGREVPYLLLTSGLDVEGQALRELAKIGIVG